MDLRRVGIVLVGSAAWLAAAPPVGRAVAVARTPIWHIRGAAVGTPAIDGDTVFFLTRGREVVAADLRSGAERWRTGTGVTSTDAIFGDTTAGTALAVTRSMVLAGDWDVVGFDKASGRREWSYTAPDGDGPGLFLGPVNGDTLFTGSPGARVYAFDTNTGRVHWSTKLYEGAALATVFPPVVDRDVVIAGYSIYGVPSRGGVAALYADTGRIRWQTEFPTPKERWNDTTLSSLPIVVDDLVFASAGDRNIYAFDLRSGAVRWAFPRLGGIGGDFNDTDNDYRTIVRAGRKIIAGSSTGYVVAYDIDTRQEVWRFHDPAAGSTMFRFVADDQRVYVPYFGGFFLVLDAATGAERWRYGDFTQGFIWPPAIVADRIVVAGSFAGTMALPITDEEPVP